MYFLKDRAAFKRAFACAAELASADERGCPDGYSAFCFEFVSFLRDGFFSFLRELAAMSSEDHFYLVVLDPDPEKYFHKHFGVYPALSFSINDSESNYFELMSREMLGSPADALNHNTNKYAFFLPNVAGLSSVREKGI